MWRNDRARVGRCRSRQAADLRPAIRLERQSDTEGRTAAVCASHIRLAAAFRDHRHLRSPNVLCQDNGQALTRQIVQSRVVRRHVERSCRRTGCTSCVIMPTTGLCRLLSRTWPVSAEIERVQMTWSA